VAYGSNLAADRFACYLSGGRPEGGLRTYEGCLDPTPARRSRAVTIPHRVGFAGRSPVWGGGMAVMDPAADGALRTPARAWLVTIDQFAGIVAQERHGLVESVDVDAAMTDGLTTLGAGPYGTVVHCGDLRGRPMLTCTSGDLSGGWTPPTAGYLRWLGRGLGESHAMSTDAAAVYLAGLPGADQAWTAACVRAVLETA
jgi:hypothetical protein